MFATYLEGFFLRKPLCSLYLLKQLYQKQTVLWCSPVLQDGAEMGCLKLMTPEGACGSIPHISSQPYLPFPCRALQVSC